MSSYSYSVDFIAYYVIAAVAIASNTAVFIYLLVKYGPAFLFSINNPYLQLLLALHFSNIFQCIALLPYIFQFNHDFCIFMESVKTYFGLMNLFTVLMIILAHRVALLNNVVQFTKPIRYFAFTLIFGFPLIVLFPFAADVYQYPVDPWCALPASANIAWAICFQYIWVWLVLFLALLSNLNIMYRVCILDQNYQLFQRYAYNCGAFSFISGLSWIPRSYAFFRGEDTNERRFIQYYPMNIAAILYCILFVANLGAITKYSNEVLNSEVTWDSEDLVKELDLLQVGLRKSSLSHNRPNSRSFSVNPMSAAQSSPELPLSTVLPNESAEMRTTTTVSACTDNNTDGLV